MDDWLFLLINRVWTNAYADRLFATLTSAAVWLPFLTVGVGVGLWFGTFRVPSFLLVAAVTLLGVGGLFNSAAKRWFHRPRPADAEPGVKEVALQKVHPAFLGVFLRCGSDTQETRVNLSAAGNFRPAMSSITPSLPPWRWPISESADL